jgi:type II secretory pathway pseudopilin PulG
MVVRTRRKNSDGLGFTLLELLLTVALLIGLLGAVVFNFQSARRGADLEEGGRQFEALIRFAAAQAANSGKAVQFRFGDDVAVAAGSGTNSSSGFATPSSGDSTNSVNNFGSIDEADDWGAKLHVVYEIDPVLQPGVFVDLREASPMIESLGDRVRIEKIQMPERPVNQGTNEVAAAQDANFTATTLTFFPDGSSETADIFLVSKEREDYREMIVHLDGVTGRIRREVKSGDDLVPVEWMEDPNAPKENQTGSTPTQSAGEEPAPSKATTTQPAPMPEDPAFEQPQKAKAENTNTNAFDDFP